MEVDSGDLQALYELVEEYKSSLAVAESEIDELSKVIVALEDQKVGGLNTNEDDSLTKIEVSSYDDVTKLERVT